MKRLVPSRFVRTRAFVDRNGVLIAFLFVVVAAAVGSWKINDLANQNSNEIALIRSEGKARREAIRQTLLFDCMRQNAANSTLRNLLLASFNITPAQSKKLSPIQRSRFISITAALRKNKSKLTAEQHRQLIDILKKLGFGAKQQIRVVNAELATIRDLSPVDCRKQKAVKGL